MGDDVYGDIDVSKGWAESVVGVLRVCEFVILYSCHGFKPVYIDRGRSGQGKGFLLSLLH